MVATRELLEAAVGEDGRCQRWKEVLGRSKEVAVGEREWQGEKNY